MTAKGTFATGKERAGGAAGAGLLGVEVAPGRVERALADFWREPGAGATRASLINLAIYSEQPGAAERNAALVAELTRDHACRAILLCAEPEGAGVRCWINAHCHTGRAGGKQVCCEQIVIALGGEARRMASSLLFAHLDSDLPLYFWWQDGFEAGVDGEILKRADRLIFDSAGWARPMERFRELGSCAGRLRLQGTLCDLNWARSLPVRRALAHVFDHPVAAGSSGEIGLVEIAHGRGQGLCAALLAVWIGQKLGWRPVAGEGFRRFVTAGGGEARVVYREEEGAAVSGLVMAAGRVEVRIQAGDAQAPVRCSICVDGVCWMSELMPPGGSDTVSLVKAELAVGCRHVAYPRLLEWLAAGC